MEKKLPENQNFNENCSIETRKRFNLRKAQCELTWPTLCYDPAKKGRESQYSIVYFFIVLLNVKNTRIF